jgi:hypothetical protein
MQQVPLHDTKNTVRIDVGRIYVGPDGGGFVNAPNDTLFDFANREQLHALIDGWINEAEGRLAARGPKE